MICWFLRPLLPCLFSKTCFWLFWNVKKQVLYKNRYFDCMSESFLMTNWHDSLTFFIYTHKKYQENTFIVHCFRPFFSVQPFFFDTRIKKGSPFTITFIESGVHVILNKFKIQSSDCYTNYWYSPARIFLVICKHARRKKLPWTRPKLFQIMTFVLLWLTAKNKNTILLH